MKTKHETITLDKAEVTHLYRCIKWGGLSELANILGVSNTTVTLMFKSKKEYNPTTMKFEDVYRMRKEFYVKLLEFIEITK